MANQTGYHPPTEPSAYELMYENECNVIGHLKKRIERRARRIERLASRQVAENTMMKTHEALADKFMERIQNHG